MVTNNPAFSLMLSRYGNDQYYEANDIPLSLTSAYTYRFGFNGQHKDNEIKGTGNSLDFGERIYDSRLGRFLSVDGLTAQYPFYSPYQFAGNDVIRAIDLDGLEPEYVITKQGKLSEPMISLLHYALDYDEGRMRNTTWKPSNTKSFNANTIYHTVYYSKTRTSPDNTKKFQGSQDKYEDYWISLATHEHKHRDEYGGMLSYLPWIKDYLKETAVNATKEGFKDGFYSKQGETEKRAYGTELQLNEIMNFEGGLAQKTLKSEYSEATKVGMMEYVGKAYKLSTMEKGSEGYDTLSKEVSDLKEKYSNEIGELGKKESREFKAN